MVSLDTSSSILEKRVKWAAYMREWSKKNPEKKKRSAAKSYQKYSERIRARVHQYKEAHSKEISERNHKYYQEHSEEIKNNVRQYRQENIGKHNALNAFRRAYKRQATPKWLTKEQKKEMQDFYINCPGGLHVDHIHPLKGDGFCGLHVPWNLQYLTATENCSKGNKIAF